MALKGSRIAVGVRSMEKDVGFRVPFELGFNSLGIYIGKMILNWEAKDLGSVLSFATSWQ